MNRRAFAIWKGNLKEGKGTVSTESNVIKEAQYSFNTRFEEGIGTNPEELLAAAHAGCFSMALSAQLTQAHMTVENIRTTATVTLEKNNEGFAITLIHLEVDASIPNADEAAFEKAANEAKKNCPLSKVLNAEITMQTKLNSR